MRPRARQHEEVRRVGHVGDERGDRALLILDGGLRDGHVVEEDEAFGEVAPERVGLAAESLRRLAVN